MRRWMPIVVLLLATCATQRLKKEQASWLAAFGNIAPPGTIQLNDSLYYDREELANFEWLEYEFWVMRTFGRRSPEHLAMLPDTTVWERFNQSGEPYLSSYLRHPAYRDYPVVGVTHAQATAYCKWRSDRVMEYYLIAAGVIGLRKDQTAQDHFTIEGFYGTDSLKAYHHLPYPSYGLPVYSEWHAAVAKADSLAVVNLPRCKRLRRSQFRGGTFGECDEVVRQGRFVINAQVGQSGDLTAPTHCWRCEKELIWQMRGNVAELARDSSTVLGGGWMDALDSILLDQPLPSNAPSVAIGFRNVCRWRTWNGARQ